MKKKPTGLFLFPRFLATLLIASLWVSDTGFSVSDIGLSLSALRPGIEGNVQSGLEETLRPATGLKEKIDKLIADLKDTNWRVRQSDADVLGQIGIPAIPSLGALATGA